MTRKSQIELIGNHPRQPNQFGKWLECNDLALSPTKCHRSLVEKSTFSEPELIEWLTKKIIEHHCSDNYLKKLKEKYRDIGFTDYAEQYRRLPRADRTKKGNTAEILLIEYIEGCLGKSLVKIFKLRYNPNVDQSMKGDDVLMVDIINNDEQKAKIYLGEAKFRKIPKKTDVDDILKSLGKDKKPISYPFLVEILDQNPDTNDIAKKLDKLIINEIKGRGDLVYTGFLLSNSNTSSVVESHLDSENPTLIFISIGIETPEDLIEKAFAKAEELIAQSDQL